MRFKNYGLWVAIGSLVTMVANDAFQVAPADVEKYVDVALTIGIAAGIINNPSNGKGYKDSTEK